SYQGLPFAADFPGILLELHIGAETLELFVPIGFKQLDPLYGDVTNYFRVVPPVSIRPRQEVWIYGMEKETQGVWLRLEAFRDLSGARLQVYEGGRLLKEQLLPDMKKGSDTLYFFPLPPE